MGRPLALLTDFFTSVSEADAFVSAKLADLQSLHECMSIIHTAHSHVTLNRESRWCPLSSLLDFGHSSLVLRVPAFLLSKLRHFKRRSYVLGHM